MTGVTPRGSIGRIGGAALLAMSLVAGVVGSPVAAAAPTPALSGWTGSVDLYRAGVFTVQKTWQWCTAADVQIIRNIVDGEADHARASQQRYFDYMRSKNRYEIPVADGVDPAGWTAGLRRYVDDRYRLTASKSFDAALRASVRNLRRTNLPVGITVAHGNHAWILTGFSATADPAATTDYEVTSVRVVGPLWGRQNRTYGYDMRPNTELTPKQLRGFFTPWHYPKVRMAWEGRWVSIQPVPVKGAVAAPTASPSPTATPAPTATPSPTPTPASVASPSAEGLVVSSQRPAVSEGPTKESAIDDVRSTGAPVGAMLLIVALLVVVVGGLGLRARRH